MQLSMLAKVAGAVLIAAALAAGGYIGWDRGIIPGNPRAPTEKAVRPVIERQIYRTNLQHGMACARPDLPDRERERFGFPGIAQAAFPGQFAVALSRDDPGPDPAGRVRAIEQLDFLVSEGLLAGEPATVSTAAGEFSGTRYTLTWSGYLNSGTEHPGWAPCYFVGWGALDSITEVKKLEQLLLGMEVYEITYLAPVKDPMAWALKPDARRLFGKVADAIAPKPEKVRLVRAKPAWRLEEEVQTEAMAGAGERSAGYQKQVRQVEAILSAEAPDEAKTREMMERFLADKPPGDTRFACLRPNVHQLPGETARIPVGAMAVKISDSLGTDVRQTYLRAGYLTAAHILNAIEQAGLGRLVEADEGVRYLLNPGVAEAAGIGKSSWDCLPIGGLRIEFLGVVPRGQVGLTIRAKGVVTHPTPLAQALAPHLPAVNAILTEGLPVDFLMVPRTDPSDMSGTGPATWVIAGATVQYPRIEVKSLPAHLTPLLPRLAAATAAAGAPPRGADPDAPRVATPPVPAASRSAAPTPAPAPPPPPGSWGNPAPAPAPAPEPSDRVSSGSRPSFAADSTEVHLVGVYEGTLPNNRERKFGEHDQGRVEVVIERGPAAILLLSGYESVEWVVQLKPGAALTRIITAGNHAQKVTVVGDRSKILIHNAHSITGFFKYGGNFPRDAKVDTDAIVGLTGKRPSTIQAAYRPKQPFVIGAGTPREIR